MGTHQPDFQNRGDTGASGSEVLVDSLQDMRLEPGPSAQASASNVDLNADWKSIFMRLSPQPGSIVVRFSRNVAVLLFQPMYRSGPVLPF